MRTAFASHTGENSGAVAMVMCRLNVVNHMWWPRSMKSLTSWKARGLEYDLLSFKIHFLPNKVK